MDQLECDSRYIFDYMCVYISHMHIQAAAEKNMADLRPWVKDIIRHFWFCSDKSEGSLDMLKVSNSIII